MLLRAFGVKVDQHVYEGVIRILYYDLPDSHVAQVLSYMVDRDMAVIKNEIAGYYNADESQYPDMR